MDMPSTTITWATMAGLSLGAVWELMDTFTAFEPSLGLVGTTTALVGGVVGKLVKEKRYIMTKRPDA